MIDTDKYEVVWGGKEYDDPNDSSVMQPRLYEYFNTEQEAIAFAKERGSEGHPRLWIEHWEGTATPVLVDWEPKEVIE